MTTIDQTHSGMTFTRRASRAPLAAALLRVIATSDDRAATVARLALGFIMLPHGLQHALGLFGGYGFSGTLGWMSGTLGFPAPLAALAIVTELLAPFLLIAGLGGRFAAVGIAGIMAGAILTHAPAGFFMNWFGKLPAGTEGYEYHLVVTALAAVVAIKGSGALSVDRTLRARLDRVGAKVGSQQVDERAHLG
jgi:putative oxidoreductase